MPAYLQRGVYLEETDPAGGPLAPDPAAHGETLKRPIFFAGQLLDAATLRAEQDYHREKLRRLNRAVLGYGTVSGLDVRVEDPAGAGGPHMVIEPGYAIDRRGEMVSIPCAVRVPLPAQGNTAFVTLRFWEQPCAPPEAAAEEACVIRIKPDIVLPAVALARLVRSNGRWQVDPAFQAPRVKRRQSSLKRP